MEPNDTAVDASAVPHLVLAAIPALRERWDEVREENADPDGVGGRLGYLDASWVVRHLVDRLVAGDTGELAPAFALIERLARDGDAYVSELAVVGYLEGLQTLTASRGIPAGTVRRRLGPLSQHYWDALDDFWANGVPIPRIEPLDDQD